MAEEKAGSNAEEQGAWARPVSTRVGELGMTGALLGSAVFFIWQSVLLPFGTVGLPGPGFFPFALGVILGFLALAILYSSLREPTKDENVYLGHRDVVIAFGAMLCVAPAFEALGAYITLGGFAAILLLLVARAALWRVVLGVSLGMIAVWAVFKIALGVQLPVGPF